MDSSIQYISINELIPSEFFPHLESVPDNLENLTNSIKNYGILEPLIVRKKADKYEIILGNRRYKVAKQLNILKVPVIILKIADEKALELIISDNIYRKELTPKEEAELYNKALTYPSVNEERLSINLGIPLDRITSKLNLLKKEKNQSLNNQSLNNQSLNNQSLNNQSLNNQSLNNKISNIKYQGFDNRNINNENPGNKDVININELNKERDEFIMNNNQFTNNNFANQINNQNIEQGNIQEPSFGGRFFPSLEDQPTNMNFGDNFNEHQDKQLIDLTNIANEPSISQQEISVSNIVQNPNTNIQEVPTANPTINMDNIPNLNTLNNPSFEQTSNKMMPTQIPMDQQFTNTVEPLIQNQLTQETQVPTSIEMPVPNPVISNEQLVQNLGTLPEIQPNLNTASIDNGIPTYNVSNENIVSPIETNIPTIDNSVNIPNYNVPPVEQNNNVENIPNYSNQMLNQQNEFNNIEASNVNNFNIQQKDITPVINIIKNIANSVEGFGYSIKITENDNQNSYSINIEVEK